MSLSNVYYNRIIRRIVTSFGQLFNDITLVRYDPNSFQEQERFLVPLAYSAKEKYVQRIQGDPDLDKKVQMSLPRMSFEMNGLNYDASRKQQTNWKNFFQVPTTGGLTPTASPLISQYNPVPYDFDFSLYVYVRNIEDGTQIIERILPYFTPDYTLKINLSPDMNIVKEVPIILKSTSSEVEYEGDRDSDTRLIIWTLDFTVKGYIFGPTSKSSQIYHSITQIYNNPSPSTIKFTLDSTTGNGNYKVGEMVYQGFTLQQSTASGKVVSWDGINLVLTNLEGNFLSTDLIVGAQSHATYYYTSYYNPTVKDVQIDITVDPTSATSADPYTYATTITEFNSNSSGINYPLKFDSFVFTFDQTTYTMDHL